MLISFNGFVKEYILKSKATSNIDIQQILSSLSLSEVEIYLRHGPFTTDMELVTWHPTKGPHWVAYNYQNNFGSYRYLPPQKLYRFIIKRKEHCSKPE